MAIKSNKVAIVIPIYKAQADMNEEISFKRSLDVFASRQIVLLAPDGLNISYYFEIAQKKNYELTVSYFPPYFFTDVSHYNQLMMSIDFYNRFVDWDYVLIYQLDAYVFYDKLDYWCLQRFDYIGAPWFENYQSYEDGCDLWTVGNGGFSLRKIPAFIDILKRKIPVKSWEKLKDDYQISTLKGLSRMIAILQVLFRIAGYKNTINYWKKQCGDNEDFFWTVYLDKLGIGLKIPKAMQAVDFAFEQSPSYLFQINGNKLPFGCHAWHRYEYETFWEKYVK